jgi:apolipoprotein N-acyltransferase
LSAPSIWTAIEFLRFWTTGNNWNAIGYSQAFNSTFLVLPGIGGVLLVSFICVLFNAFYSIPFILRTKTKYGSILSISPLAILLLITIASSWSVPPIQPVTDASIIAVQPNVPMSGLTEAKWLSLRKKHVELAETALQKSNQQPTTDHRPPTTVIFPESPMNFMYDRDEEFQKFVRDFASRNNVNVLFNAAEPDAENNKLFNSAVMVNAEGKIAQYDKIYLVPFGESVPAPLQNIVPALVGSFSFGKEYDLLPFGEASGGVMICFESHFPNLSREYVRRGADVLVEMTNDGYLGETPVLRQHLANAVFRAVETARPVLRVTNVGITAYINERGEILNPTESYAEDTRVWTTSKSDGSQTFYVKYGDWFAWLCSIASLGLVFLAFWKNKLTGINRDGQG